MPQELLTLFAILASLYCVRLCVVQAIDRLKQKEASPSLLAALMVALPYIFVLSCQTMEEGILSPLYDCHFLSTISRAYRSLSK